MHRGGARGLEVLLILPGGPYWTRRDVGAWQIPKGGIEAGEQPEEAAIREFDEEMGVRPIGIIRPLGQIRQAGGKRVEAFAVEGSFDVKTLSSILFELEWPPRSGRRASFPEVEKAAWFTMKKARQMILPSQAPLLDSLERLLAEEAKT